MKKAFVFFLFAVCSAYSTTPPVPVVVIGGGVGGFTTALALCRVGVTPLVFEGKVKNGALTQSHAVQNWPTEVEISGSELVEKIRHRAVASGAIIQFQEVVEVDFNQYPFKLVIEDPVTHLHTEITALACVVATGSNARKLGIPGEEAHWQRGVYLCPICDGHLVKHKRAMVVGEGDMAITQADYLSTIAEHVWLISSGNDLNVKDTVRKNAVLARPNVHVLYHTSLTHIESGDSCALTVFMQDLDAQIAREIDVDGVFLATKREPNSKLFQNQLQLDDTGHICLLEHQCASIPGVFAVGTVADPCYGLAICAAGDGAKAALDVKKYLSSLRDHPFFLEPALEKPKKTAVIEILNLEHFYKELSTAQLPVIVDCHMTGCLYCEELTPFFEMWALRLAEKYTFLKVNLCDIPVLREKYEIGSTPTVLFFDQNQQLIDALERDTVYSFFSNL